MSLFIQGVTVNENNKTLKEYRKENNNNNNNTRKNYTHKALITDWFYIISIFEERERDGERED